VPSVTISYRHSLAANALTPANCHCIAVTLFNTTHKQSAACVTLQTPTAGTNITALVTKKTNHKSAFYFTSLYPSLIGTTMTMKSLNNNACGKPEGNIPFGRPRCRCVDNNIKPGTTNGCIPSAEAVSKCK